jgi:hypothetical protein
MFARDSARGWGWALLAVLGAGLRVAAAGPTEDGPGAPPGPLDRPLESAPSLLQRPLESTPLDEGPLPSVLPELFQIDTGAPTGFTGPSGIVPRELQQDSHFVPVEDRWRSGIPAWDRYGKGHPPLDDYPYDVGHWWDPYHQNVLKADYPILGQNTFLEVTAASVSLFEPRQIPTATPRVDAAGNPIRQMLGNPNQFFYNQVFSVTFDLFHGDAAFKPVDWRIRITPASNINYLQVEEAGVVNFDPRKGTRRARTFSTLQEWFVEKKIADLSPSYDFLSVRAGSQPFVSDFRGFIFSDTNRAIRIFGTREANRDQFNLAYFVQQEKDTNSTLNTFNDRTQQVLIANYYRQDFIWPGYTLQGSVHYDHDRPSVQFDRNNFLVRPDPIGPLRPHGLDVAYLGLTGDGHINRFNITHAFYWALGRDSFNPLAGQAQDINAQMAAVELSYDRDWVRFRTSWFWASGDGNVNNKHATGFDSILDNPNFAGGQFSYWQHQNLRLFATNLKSRFSLVPDLRFNKLQGQSNFVNPGLQLANAGVDLDLTPKLRMINNYNLLWFDKTSSLEKFTAQSNLPRFLGADLSAGFEYRPLLSNNVIVTLGVATLLPGDGFTDLYKRLANTVPPFVDGFMQVNLTW